MLWPSLIAVLAVLALLGSLAPSASALARSGSSSSSVSAQAPVMRSNAGARAGAEGARVPWAEQYATREHLNALPKHTTDGHWVGELQHDRHRQRALHEDTSLPLPVHIHSLGHNRHTHPAAAAGRHRHSSASQAQAAHKDAQKSRRQLAGTVLPALITPLYQGYGTHFSYVYIGSPPQRQSVIVDTGSHFTAFPCVGCQLCGSHTDNYWDPKNSTTVEVQKCNSGDTCSFGQSYSEGSSWRAYKVIDKLWVGGIGKETVPTGSKYQIDFMFGCQTSETGLFRTQLADGIMGMAMAVDTLPSQLVEQKVATSNIFAMCFRVGGGIMTLGGVDQRIHSKPGIMYAGIRATDGWYTITLLDIQLMDQGSTRTKKTIGADPGKYSAGKGVIVDSGTTDTYLPMGVATEFARVFQEITGIAFSSKNIKISEADLAKIPDVVFVIQGVDGKPFDVIMPWNNYMDKVGTDLYAFRIYLTEGSGAVLGANFMDGYNVIFDKSNKRVGFAKSDCVYESFAVKETDAPTAAPSAAPGATPTAPVSPGCVPLLKAVSECNARCNTYQEENHTYKKTGTQDFVQYCAGSAPNADSKKVTKECTLACAGSKVVRGVDSCPEKAWNVCLKSCIQSRDMPDQTQLAKSVCTYTQQTRSCYSGDCPMQDGDMLVFIDMRVGVQPAQWSYVYSEAFFGALSAIFKVNAQNIELLNDARSEYYLSAKLHFQIRLKSKDYAGKKELTAAAQSIPVLCWKENFAQTLIAALEVESKRVDQIDYSRYGFLNPETDIEVLNAVALPIGEVRDPIDIPVDSDEPVVLQQIKAAFEGKEEYFFVGVGIAVSCIMCCVLWLYIRLHHENVALAKEKVQNSTLMKMLQKVKGWRSGQKVEFDEQGHEYSEVEMGESMGRGGNGNAVNPLHDEELGDEDIND